VLREENATVLPFRDSALRRPIDVVAWINTHLPQEPDATAAPDNLVPLARFSRSWRRGNCPAWLPPDGEAA